MRWVTAGHEIESEVGLCIDYSGRSVRSKAMSIPLSTAFPVLNFGSLSCQILILKPLLFPFIQQRKVVYHVCYVAFVVMPGMKKSFINYASILVVILIYVFSSAYMTAPFCQPTRQTYVPTSFLILVTVVTSPHGHS